MKHLTTRPLLLVTALSVAALLGACATPGREHTPLALKTPAALGLGEAASMPVAPRWWTTLGDEGLTRLVDQALQAQPSLAVARARVERARALADLNQASTGPQAVLSAEATRQRYSSNGLVPKPIAGSTWDSGTLQAGLSWSPDFFGQHAAELAAALGQARAAQADAAAAATALAAQISRSYVALARLLAQRDVLTRVLAQRSEMLELTRQRVAAGLDTRTEQTQAEGALPDTRVQIEALDEQVTLARHQIAVLAGQAPGALDTLSPRLQQLALAPVPATLGADLLGRRPDVVAARWRVEAATQDVAVARTQFYPNINLSAFAGLNAIGLDQVFQASSRQMGVTPALRLPLFDGGRLRAQLGGRQAELDTAIAQYNGVLLEATREASDALSSTQSLTRQQGEQASALTSAGSAYALAQQRFRAGIGNYLVVLNTESQQLAQQRLTLDLQARQLDTRVALMKALGGGWTDDTAVPDTALATPPATTHADAAH
jgi:NodT family efflux transporter outer membrane factor (OMF) lipoprotein